MALSYPIEILPRNEYELRLDIPLLLRAYSNLYVARRIDGEREKCIYQIDGDFLLLDEALDGISAANFSVNLLGGCFDVERHNHCRPLTKSFSIPWNGEEVPTDISEDMFELKHPCFAVYYEVEEYLKFPLEETITLNKDKDYQAFITKEKAKGVEDKYLNAFKKGEPMIFAVNKKVNHMPTYCNYWHVTLDTYSFDALQTPIMSSGNRNSIDRMLKFMRHNFLTMRCVFDTPEFDILSQCFYYQGNFNVIMRKFIPIVQRIRNVQKRLMELLKNRYKQRRRQVQ